MNITCPSCGCKGSLELFLADREFREAILHAAELPSNVGLLALRYVGLFRPAQRQLTPARAGKLIHEVLELVTSNPTIFDRQEVNIPAYMWKQALQVTLDKPNLQRPLKNHNFLIKVAISLATQPDKNTYTEDEAPAPVRNASTGQSMKAVGAIVDGSAEQDAKAETTLQRMKSREKTALFAKAKQNLIDSGIPEDLIIKPMLDGMVLSIIKGNA